MTTINAVLIAGPTASGKSALAMTLAEKIGGVIVNADSMQVYRDLRIITARPTQAEEMRIPHKLYGHVDAAENYSVGAWCRDAGEALKEIAHQRRVPVLVGGTGLYFKALTTGLAAVPPIPADIRTNIRSRLQREGAPALHAELNRLDPATAQRVTVNDRSRISRAIEVVLATGRPLSDWHREGLPPLIESSNAAKVFLTCERKELVRRIDARFAAMLTGGALEEVKQLAARQLDRSLPAMKAHGVPWLMRYLNSQISRDEAMEGAVMDTRRYAKRQLTWFRTQLKDWAWESPERAQSVLESYFSSLK
ncbi:MAG TPA: tRNA (adenosine(37)-N6)-dimethylallyltransferase MiaA [Pseudolabrys sp.]|nr:tRNA (adenosine(37)-N6)-dimethylallyltransferase MiaA [Pseudolabrys sp.]